MSKLIDTIESLKELDRAGLRIDPVKRKQLIDEAIRPGMNQIVDRLIEEELLGPAEEAYWDTVWQSYEMQLVLALRELQYPALADLSHRDLIDREIFLGSGLDISGNREDN
jgi:hypothetical protein